MTGTNNGLDLMVGGRVWMTRSATRASTWVVVYLEPLPTGMIHGGNDVSC
ncbi:MAG: hypothetical protein U0R69_01075 [Gaiellales bacterium]